MKKKSLVIILYILIPFFSFAQNTLQNFQYSLVRLKVDYSTYSSIQPWQKNTPKSRTGQGIAISSNEILAIADLIKDHDLIRIKTAFQTKLLEAKVKVVDYETNLCVLTIDSNELKHELVPFKFLADTKIGQKVDLIWMTNSQRFRKTQGIIETPYVETHGLKKTSVLKFQISQNSSPGGYSEPVLVNKKVLGLVDEINEDKNSSEMISSLTILGFLERASKEPYQKIPLKGFKEAAINTNATRSYYKIPEDEDRGILITTVYDFGTGSKDLKKNDIILSIGGYDIDVSKNILHKHYGKLKWEYIFTQKKLNDTVPFEILRDGQTMTLDIKMERFENHELTIPQITYNTAPSYSVICGFIFQELNFDFINEYGSDWNSTMDPLLVEKAYSYSIKKHSVKKRFVILNQVLKHPINKGYQGLRSRIIEKIDGIDIKDLEHLKELFKKIPEDDFHTIELSGFTPTVVIPHSVIESTNQQIQQIYRLNQLEK